MKKDLTPEQIAKMPEYTKNWISIGNSTERFTQKEAEEVVFPFQLKIMELKENVPVLITDSPMQAWRICCLLESNLVTYSPSLTLEDYKLLIEKHFDEIKGITFETPYLTGSYESAIFSFYDYMINEVKVEIDQEILEKYLLWQSTSKFGLIYPLDSVWIVSQKPIQYSFNDKNQYHCDGGPAVTYADGLKMWCLNGVTVSQELAETPEEDLTIDMFINETNADIKAEFVRKYGVERMLSFGKQVDDYTNYSKDDYPFWHASEYQLWDMAVLFDGLDYQPYLKMLNQTTKIWHVEAVSPECRTIQDAMTERFGGQALEIVEIK